MAGQGSARVSLREIDLSAPTPVKRVLTGTPAGVVGRAKRGPAFVPTFFADMNEFEEKFGSLRDRGIDSNANLYGPLAVSEWMSGNPGSGAFVRVLGVGDGDSSESGAGFTVGETQLDDDGERVNNTFLQNTGILTGGRTYFLGHTVKDKTGSSYLSDCDLKIAATGKIKISAIANIVMNDGSSSGDTFTLIDTEENEFIFEFSDDGTNADNNNIPVQKVPGQVNTTLQNVINAINDTGSFLAVLDPASSTDTVLITQNVKGSNGNTNITSTSSGIVLTDFTGGDDGFITNAVIRGILMTPQGVQAQFSGSSGFGTTGSIGTKEEFVLKLDNFITASNGHILSCSFNPDASNYFGKIMNTNPYLIKERGHYLYASWDMSTSVIETTGSLGFCTPTSQSRNSSSSTVPNFENFVDRYKTAHSPWVVSQAFGTDPTGASNADLGDKVIKLFRIHALDDGEIANNQFKITISNLAKGDLGNWGTFDLSIDKLISNPVKGNTPLIKWSRLSLDTSSPNYIARVIGDKYMKYDFDASGNKQGLVEYGIYDVKNPFVRVEMSEDVEAENLDKSSLPAGFGGLYELNTSHADVFTATQVKGARALPIPMIRSIGKGTSASGREVGALIPWGIKFGSKKNIDSAHAEYSEQDFNMSLLNYSKFFHIAETGASPWKQPVDSEGNLDFSNDLNFFHLEKIKITPKADGTADPKKWGDAIFHRTDAVSDDTTGTNRRFLRIEKDLNILNTKYMSFSFIMQGGFDGLNIFDEDQHKLSNAGCVKEGKVELSGPTIVAYQKGIDAFSDKSTSNIQILTTPGIREPFVTDYAIKQAEERFDTMYIMDIEEKTLADSIILSETEKVSVENTLSQFESRQLDTSFAAAYFPDVVLNKQNGGSLKVPPTVCMLGVFSRLDRDRNPWYAPAGITSGLVNASSVAFSLGRDQLNELYDADINPIYIPSGRNNVHVFGQKTLLKEPSALDRINVRRLLIYVRREVKNIANRFLFEPNREQTLANFAAAVEPILQRVQNEGGVERYKVQIDSSTTTQNDVENNIIRGKIYLQPTKSIEFISLDFEVRNSID
jgi:hypothetical protein